MPVPSAIGYFSPKAGRCRPKRAPIWPVSLHRSESSGDRKSTRLNSITNAHLVCRLLLEKKNHSYTNSHSNIHTVMNTEKIRQVKHYIIINKLNTSQSQE